MSKWEEQSSKQNPLQHTYFLQLHLAKSTGYAPLNQMSCHSGDDKDADLLEFYYVEDFNSLIGYFSWRNNSLTQVWVIVQLDLLFEIINISNFFLIIQGLSSLAAFLFPDFSRMFLKLFNRGIISRLSFIILEVMLEL